jgi:hypothetical protein
VASQITTVSNTETLRQLLREVATADTIDTFIAKLTELTGGE